MPSKTFNVGVIGYGLSAKVFHIPFILTTPGLKLYAIVQRRPTPENDASKDHPGIKSYRSVDELLTDPSVNTVVVTTTPEVHFEQAKAALEAGKNVIVEKPFCPTSKECNELIQVSKHHGKLLTVYQNRRYDTDFLTLQKLINVEALGRIVDFETHFDRYVPKAADTWKGKVIPGGAAIYDLGTHLLDQVVFLFGMPKTVTAFIGTQKKPENNPHGYEDYFMVVLGYGDGLTATAKGSVISPETQQLRYWVRGEKGSFKKYYVDLQEPQLRHQGLKPTDDEYAQEPEEHYGTLTRVQPDGTFQSEAVRTVTDKTYRTYYEKFGSALAGNGDVPVPPEMPAQVIRLIELAKESAKAGRTITL